MPFNGSGAFTPLSAPDYPAVPGDVIYADRFNNNIDDIHSGLSTCLTKDGQTNPSANLPMNGFKHTGAADAAAAGQYLVYNQAGRLAQLGIGAAPSGTRALEISGALAGLHVSNTVTNVLTPGDGVTFGAVGTVTNHDLRFYTNNTAKLLLDASGNLIPLVAGQLGSVGNRWGAAYGTSLDLTGNLVAANVLSGTYTPTLTNVTNVASSSAGAAQYMRVGSVVTVSGSVTVDTTVGAGAITELGISLPIASNLSATGHCAGTAAAVLSDGHGKIEADTTNDRAQLAFSAAADTSNVWHYTFTYRIA